MKLQEQADSAFKAAEVMKKQNKQLSDALKAQTYKAEPAAKPDAKQGSSVQQTPSNDKKQNP